MLNLFSFAGPFFVVICVFDDKKVISLDGCTFTHYKVTTFYLCVRKFYMSIQIIFHLEPLFVLQIQNSHIQIDLWTLNPRQIIATIHRFRSQSFTRGRPSGYIASHTHTQQQTTQDEPMLTLPPPALPSLSMEKSESRRHGSP